MLSLYNCQARGIHHPNVVVGMAIFCGGLAQLLAGMWEFPRGNVFGATGEWQFHFLVSNVPSQFAFRARGALLRIPFESLVALSSLIYIEGSKEDGRSLCASLCIERV